MFRSREQASTCPCCYGRVARCHLPWPLPAALGVSAGLPWFRGAAGGEGAHASSATQSCPGEAISLPAMVTCCRRGPAQFRGPELRSGAQGEAAPVSGAQLSNAPTQGLLWEAGSSGLPKAFKHTCRSQTILPTLPTKPPGSLRRSKAVTEATAKNSESSGVSKKVKGKTGTFTKNHQRHEGVQQLSATGTPHLCRKRPL